MSELSEVFNEETPETNEVEQVESEPEPTSEPEQAETQEPESKEEDSKEPDVTDKEKAYLAQAKDERQKRKERDERIRELEARLAEAEKGEVKTPDVFEDQEAYTAHLRNEFQQQLSKTRLDVAREMMMSFHDDYEEVESYVLEQINDNPALKAELQQSPNVAKAVYEYGKKMQQFNEMKQFDPKEYEAKLREKWEAEQKEKQSETSLSPSLADARGSNAQDYKEITDISDVF